MLVGINSNAVVAVVSMALNALGMHRSPCLSARLMQPEADGNLHTKQRIHSMAAVNDHAQLLQVHTMPHEV